MGEVGDAECILASCAAVAAWRRYSGGGDFGSPKSMSWTG